MSKQRLGAILSVVTLLLALLGAILSNNRQDVVASPSVIPTEESATNGGIPSKGSLGSSDSLGMTEATSTAVTTTNALVVRAVDGDTLTVRRDGDQEDVKVRMLGVDTPETVDPRKAVQCFGKEASAFTASLVDGKRVRLDADPLADEVDKYGRLLRNVILEDGRDMNALLVQEGYAYAYLSFPLNPVRKAELKRLQSEAEEAKRGLWAPEGCNGQPE